MRGTPLLGCFGGPAPACVDLDRPRYIGSLLENIIFTPSRNRSPVHLSMPLSLSIRRQTFGKGRGHPAGFGSACTRGEPDPSNPADDGKYVRPGETGMKR